MNEYYDLEDEDEDLLPTKPTGISKPIIDPASRDQVTQRLMNYYRSQLNPRPSDESLTPTDIYTRSALETAGLQGVAQGLAQAGTTFGKTPSSDSFVQSSDKTTKALGENAMQLAQATKIDPQVVKYLLSQPKTPDLKSTNLISPKNKPLVFNPRTGEYTEGNLPVRRDDKVTGTKEPKMEVDVEEKVKLFAKKSGELKAGNIALKERINEYKNAVEAYKKTGDARYRDNAIRIGQTALKILNSAGVGGSDAVGAEEVERLGSELTYQIGNLTKPGPFKGYDLQGFQDKVDSVIRSSDSAINDLENEISRLKGKTQPVTQTPAIQPQTPTTGSLSPAQKAELEARRKIKAQQGSKP